MSPSKELEVTTNVDFLELRSRELQKEYTPWGRNYNTIITFFANHVF